MKRIFTHFVLAVYSILFVEVIKSGWAYVGKESREGLYKDAITVWVVVLTVDYGMGMLVVISGDFSGARVRLTRRHQGNIKLWPGVESLLLQLEGVNVGCQSLLPHDHLARSVERRPCLGRVLVWVVMMIGLLVL